MISAFPKIFALGTTYIGNIFDDEVEITEKVDGSQFAFGVKDGILYTRSKGTQIHGIASITDKDLFYPAMKHVTDLYMDNVIPEGYTMYCETLKSVKHNTLKYNRVPKNNLILFGISCKDGSFINDYEMLKQMSETLDIETVPLLYRGKVDDIEKLHELLNTESVFGGPNIEGFVVKNYNQKFLLGGQPMPLMSGKYVSEAFKEVHINSWKKENTGKGKWDLYKEGFRTEARWNKAIQHLKEKGELEDSPRDIGALIKEVHRDITEEEKDNIKEYLWKNFGSEVLRISTRGLPEYYKQTLMENSIK